jgi:ABC-type multidrug transport system fused ATPase/permease subunit
VVLGWTVLASEKPNYHPDDIVLYALTAAQIIEVLGIIFALFLVERRPDIFRPDGHVVERQFKGSLWLRYTFNWSSELLDLAAIKLIEINELPALDSLTRAKEVTEVFKTITLKDTLPLWVLIVWSARARLLWQWTLITISCFFDVAPQFAMMKLLQFLEARRGFDAIDPQAWFWVGALFVITVGSTLIDHRLMWTVFSDIGIPLRSILTTLIFEKMMRLKDIKEPSKAEAEGSKDDASKSKPAEDSETSSPPEVDKRPTQQDVVNMFAVDTNLVAVFVANSQMYLNFVVRFVLAIVFLWYLVGWQSMLAGMVSMAFTFPVNHYLGKRYAGYQKALMKARDKKTTVITEALNGIRQIKFSAIEEQWSQKLEEVREEELGKLWKSKVNTVIMGVASDLTPVLFAVFALATYSYLMGDLLPSIAFTALSLFIQLEGLTGMLPYLMTMGVNAKVSVDRIDKFLHAPERVENTYPGESVSFYNASISFPSESTNAEDDKFVLRDITLDFPNNSLSVISGPTGSGKSLLLAAILGEAEVLAGNIRVPRPPPIEERFDDEATSANWILPTAIAFISQTPWIQNATLKDNILFGLPLDPIRYGKVIKACALVKDLAMFEDGDSTEVGAQGISLSGGQKWRLTLARAFYSRAGILILDDVFSALDAHVGKEIYDNALMGELSEGRTRILVTHHVSLCLPRAKYAVRLGARGTLDHAGLVEDLRQTGSFEDILKAENETESTESGDVASSGTTLLDENAGSVEVVEDTPAAPKPTPKKLVEDERRETGSVKKSVYMEYFKATGGVPFWSLVVFVYLLSQSLTLGRSWWIKIWTSSYEHAEDQVIHFTHSYTMQAQFLASPKAHSVLPTPPSNLTLLYYLGIYVGISLLSVFVSAGRLYLVYRGALSASRSVFREMTYSVLRTPLRWLDTTPTGRILNRFTADFQNVDSQLSQNFAYVAGCALEMIGILVAA